MFDRIAPIYDAMNSVMTAGLDARWRRMAVRAARLGADGSAVDVACGSGALTRLLARAVGARGIVMGVDASATMLRVAARRAPAPGSAPIEYVEGDALALPSADDAFDAATIAFGLRNVSDYRACLTEMVRVTRPTGRVVVLELATPSRGPGAVGGRHLVRSDRAHRRPAGRGRIRLPLPAEQRASLPAPVGDRGADAGGRAARRGMASIGGRDGHAPRRHGALTSCASCSPVSRTCRISPA